MTGKFKVIPINISGSFFFFLADTKNCCKFTWKFKEMQCSDQQKQSWGKKKKKTKLEDSHFPISNLLQSNSNQYHVILAQGQT